jgi:hypothetical protein
MGHPQYREVERKRIAVEEETEMFETVMLVPACMLAP